MTAELPAEIGREVVGRRAELRLLLGAVERGKAILLLGLPGVSKTTMVRALARHLGNHFVDATGDEQLTAQALVGGFDPPMVLKDGYRPEHFVPGPLARAMREGGILYVEELNRAPSGALNALMTALSDGYVEVPRLGRIEARPGFTVVGAANPLDDVGTARLSRGLADRFLMLELDYQPRDEELAIVRRRCGAGRAGQHAFAVDVARASRDHPDLRHGASVRGAIDFIDLLSGYPPDELDLAALRFLGCSAYAGKLRLKPTAGRSACEIVHELIDLVLRRDYRGSVQALLQEVAPAPAGERAASEEPGDASFGEEAETARAGGGDQPPGEPDRPDEIPGLSRPGGGEAGESRSVPMVDRDQPSARGTRGAGDARDGHLRDPEAVLRAAREFNLRARTGIHRPGGASGLELRSEPWTDGRSGQLDVGATIDAFVAGAATLQREDYRLLEREPHVRHYVILVDHSGSMAGGKLEVAATMAAALAQLSAAGRGRYAVVAFDDELTEIKALDEDRDVEEVIERILRLPEGRATDLSRVLATAAELAGELPEATDAILISDCMPTRGATTFPPLASLAARIPSLYICFVDERSPAVRIFHGDRQLDLYQWWARQWVGEERLVELRDPEELDRLVDLLSTNSTQGP
ncbi:MAG: AAA family ATPase [Solirubrobacteraceae bacterium]